MARGIYWLASYPRSGNTWLRAFLHAFMDIRAGRAPNLTQLNRYSTVLDRFGQTQALLGGRHPTPREAARLWPQVQAMAVARAKGPLFVKTHLAALFVFGAPAINRSATRGAVYLVRNPLDVVCSLAPHIGTSLDEAISILSNETWANGDPARVVPEVVSSWSVNVETWTVTSGLNPLVLRYEDMIADPETAFGRFAADIGLPSPPETVRAAVEATRFDRLQQTEKADLFKERPSFSQDRFFRKGEAGQWRSVLTPAQVERIVADHGPVMERFGYLP